jgi:4-amino-4-deoxy-L-arabinose transferase-like glycosyltransferase
MSDATVAIRSKSNSLASSFSIWWTKVRTSLPWMVLIALGLRLGTVVFMHTYKFRTNDLNFSFGWEMGRIGAAIATGRGFADPFEGHTGLSAWEPPLYPYLIAGVFKIFGVYSLASAFVMLALSSIFSALTCIPVFLIAKRCFGEKVAVAAAWTWALLPYVMFWSTKVVWETSLSALFMAILFLLTLTMEEKDGLKPWALYGLLWGAAALNSTSLLSFLPASGLWIWYRRSKRGKRSFAGIVLAAVLFLACNAPWVIRNHNVFGKFIFSRDNFGAELSYGNVDWAEGTCLCFLHPTQNVYAMHQYLQLGELGYVNLRKERSMAFIKARPGRFLWVSVKRFIFFWDGAPKLTKIWWLAETKNSLFLASSVLMLWGLGRALRKRIPNAWLFFWLTLLYPAIYYFVYALPRYRHPMEPILLILGIYLISEAEINGRPIGSV